MTLVPNCGPNAERQASREAIIFQLKALSDGERSQVAGPLIAEWEDKMQRGIFEKRVVSGFPNEPVTQFLRRWESL